MNTRFRLHRVVSLLILLALIFSLTANAVPARKTLIAQFTFDPQRFAELNGSAPTGVFADQLSALSRIIYDNLVKNILTMRSGTARVKFPMPPGTTESQITNELFNDAFYAFYYDHNEVFWLDYSKLLISFYWEDNRLVCDIELGEGNNNYFRSTYRSEQDVIRGIESFNSRVRYLTSLVDRDAPIYEQLKVLHDWLVLNNEYNTNEYDADPKAFTAVSALEGHNAGAYRPVCEGYSRAFKVLCDEIGIPCTLVFGVAKQGGTSGNHMWNAVKIVGEWFSVDITWDDRGDNGSGISYTYFLVGSDSEAYDTKFSEGHVVRTDWGKNSSAFKFPHTSAARYDKTREDMNPLISTLENFAVINTYRSGLYDDVNPGDWFEPSVKAAYELGLMIGSGAAFNVSGDVTLVETITMAARLHRIYTAGNDKFPVSTGEWYQTYVDYAIRNGIIPGELGGYNRPVTRAQFAEIFAASLPEGALEGINDIPDGAIPDVSIGDSYGAAVYRLYRAGILRGNDSAGVFAPETSIKRSEAATITSRMAVESLRVQVVLEYEGEIDREIEEAA